MRHILLGLLATTIFSSVTAFSQDSVLLSRQPERNWTIALGTAFLLPENDYYDRLFDHGYNLRASVTYSAPQRYTVGFQYRQANKTGTERTSHNIHAHFFGLKIGPDLLARESTGLSLAGLLYFTYVWESYQRDINPATQPFVEPKVTRDEYGLGLGVAAEYARPLGGGIAVGLEAEYNFTWLAWFSDSEYGNVGGLWVGPWLRFGL